jgi:hypothetical protein
VNDLDQLCCRLGVERLRILGWIDQMGADVILDHLHQQAVDRATATGDLMHEQSADSNQTASTMNAISMLAELSIRIVSRKSQLGSTWEARAPISVDGGHGARREAGHRAVHRTDCNVRQSRLKADACAKIKPTG